MGAVNSGYVQDARGKRIAPIPQRCGDGDDLFYPPSFLISLGWCMSVTLECMLWCVRGFHLDGLTAIGMECVFLHYGIICVKLLFGGIKILVT